MMDRMYILKTRERVRSTQIQFASQPDVTFSRWPPPTVLNESVKWIPLCEGVLNCFRHVWLFVTLWTAAHRLLCLWDSLGKNTWVGCHTLPQGIFLTQELNLHLHSWAGRLYCWATGDAWIHLYTMSPPYFQKELNAVNILKKLYEMAELLRYLMSSQVKYLVSL